MDLKEFFQTGIANDLFMAKRHFFVYRTIGEHADLINKSASTVEKSSINYIQGLAMEHAITSLYKAFDSIKSRSGKFKVKSFRIFLEEDLSNYGDFPFSLEYFESMEQLQELVNFRYPDSKINSRRDFVEFLQKVLILDIVSQKMKSLKIVRDKYIAHNAYLFEVPKLPTFWEDFGYLNDLGNLMIDSIGQVFFNTSYFQYEKIGFNNVHYTISTEFYWIEKMICKVIGEDNFKVWWRN